MWFIGRSYACLKILFVSQQLKTWMLCEFLFLWLKESDLLENESTDSAVDNV
jgi:hypothetical protein